MFKRESEMSWFRAGAAANHSKFSPDTGTRFWPSAHSDHAVAGACLAVAMLYATLRYNIFKHVPWADWPTYVVNKAFGVSSLMLLALTAIRWSIGNSAGKKLMLWSGSLTGAHVVLSLVLLKPEYYPKFFDGSKFTNIAAFSLLIGAAAFALQELGARDAKSWRPVSKKKILGLLIAITGVHAALPGFSGWFALSTWPGGLPPITLISSIIATLAVSLLMLAGRKPASAN